MLKIENANLPFANKIIFSQIITYSIPYFFLFHNQKRVFKRQENALISSKQIHKTSGQVGRDTYTRQFFHIRSVC